MMEIHRSSCLHTMNYVFPQVVNDLRSQPMEILIQDIFNIIALHLSRESMIELSCSSKKINKLFDPESLWALLLKRDYPSISIDLSNMSYYEMYVQEFRNRNITTYVGIYYNTEYKDEYYGNSLVNNYEDMRNDLPRFLTKQDAYEWLWDHHLLYNGKLKRHCELKPHLQRLRKVIPHWMIIDILYSENSLNKLIKIVNEYFEIQDFLYDEDIDIRECLDLIEDYHVEVIKNKDIVWKMLENPNSKVSIKSGMCGWNIIKIETRKGIREYDDGTASKIKCSNYYFC